MATIQRNAEYQSAVDIWQTVVERRPHGRAHANLAVALRDAGRVDDAIAQLRLAAPDNPEAKHALGSALLERGDPAEAVAHLDEFVRTRPGDPEIESARTELAQARRQLIVIRLKEERFKEAEAEARSLVSSDPDDAEAHNLLGVSLASQDRLDEAAREFAEAVRLSPEFKDARDNLGRADSLRRALPR
jgi:Flp pilus assembly protein TadD